MEQENNINIGLSIPDIMDKESEENRTFESGEKKKKVPLIVRTMNYHLR